MTTVDPMPLEAAQAQALHGITTATLTTVLLKKGLRNVWLRGALPVPNSRSAIVETMPSKISRLVAA